MTCAAVDRGVRACGLKASTIKGRGGGTAAAVRGSVSRAPGPSGSGACNHTRGVGGWGNQGLLCCAVRCAGGLAATASDFVLEAGCCCGICVLCRCDGGGGLGQRHLILPRARQGLAAMVGKSSSDVTPGIELHDGRDMMSTALGFDACCVGRKHFIRHESNAAEGEGGATRIPVRPDSPNNGRCRQ